MAGRKRQVIGLEHALFMQATKRKRLVPPKKHFIVHFEKSGRRWSMKVKTLRDVETVKEQIESEGGKFLMYGEEYQIFE